MADGRAATEVDATTSDRGKATDEDVPEDGTWCDTYALHFPPPRRAKAAHFDRDVGTEGYDRGTGTEVPTDPRFKRPGASTQAVDPFAEA